MPGLIVLLFIPSLSFGFLDFVGEQTKKAAETLAYADAVGELLSEVSNETELKDGAQGMRKRTEALRSEIRTLNGISYSTKAVLEGPDWSSKRLDTNIRNTTDYVRRLKKLLIRIAALGTDGATALNTTETNIALNEVQKNQQTMILQLEDQRLRNMEKESDEAKKWDQFTFKRRKLRVSESKSSGKLK